MIRSECKVRARTRAGAVGQGAYRALAGLRIQGHEVAEIARQSGRSKRTVERILQDVRARLRQLLVDVD
jgi:hypothetical protein